MYALIINFEVVFYLFCISLDYVLEAEGKLMPGVRLVVNKQWTHDDKPATERVVSAGNEQTLDSDNEQGEENTDL